MELYNTGIDKAYSQDELSKLFNINKKDFLKSPDIPVIKRQFNWLPSLKGDPPRALTDPKPVPIVHYENVGVVSDFHKGFNAGPTGKMWQDGTYDDMKQKVSKDNQELYKDVKFASDYDFDMRFNRLEQEQSLQANISNYFLEKQQEKELANRIILEQYGLNPEQVDKALAEKRVADAMKGLGEGKRHYVPNGARFEEKLKQAVRMHKAEHPEAMDMLQTPKLIKETTDSLMTPRKKMQLKIAKEVGTFNIQKTLAPIKDDVQPEIDAEPSSRYRQKPLTEKQMKKREKEMKREELIKQHPIMRSEARQRSESPAPKKGKGGNITNAERARREAEEAKRRGTQPTMEQIKGLGAGAGRY